MSLEGRRIVVTGASAGPGAHTVRVLVGRGAHIVAAGRRLERLEALAAGLADGPGRVVACRADVTSAEDAELLVAALPPAASCASGGCGPFERAAARTIERSRSLFRPASSAGSSSGGVSRADRAAVGGPTIDHDRQMGRPTVRALVSGC